MSTRMKKSCFTCLRSSPLSLSIETADKRRGARAATLTLAALLAQDKERKARRSASPKGGGNNKLLGHHNSLSPWERVKWRSSRVLSSREL
jgi:hypothetical protein